MEPHQQPLLLLLVEFSFQATIQLQIPLAHYGILLALEEGLSLYVLSLPLYGLSNAGREDRPLRIPILAVSVSLNHSQLQSVLDNLFQVDLVDLLVVFKAFLDTVSLELLDPFQEWLFILH